MQWDIEVIFNYRHKDILRARRLSSTTLPMGKK